jgi:hypothetical protein
MMPWSPSFGRGLLRSASEDRRGEIEGQARQEGKFADESFVRYTSCEYLWT